MTVTNSEQSEKALKEALEEVDNPLMIETAPERTRENRTPGFARMRTDWHGPDHEIIQNIMGTIERRILENFSDAYALMNEVYDAVRDPACDSNGEVLKDHYGFIVWARNPMGAPYEDFTKLTSRQKEDFMFKITTRIFEWQQRAADAWAEAMFAKAQWEEAFSNGFDSPAGRLTVDDRTQKGRLYSREERYFAVFLSAYSRKADAIVRSMELLGQRIKDSLG